MKIKYRYIILIAIFLLDIAQCYAYNFLPAVKYYSVKDINAAHQNWSASQSSDGVMYFGNNDGLLSFDGYRWKITKMPTKEIVRSVMCDEDRIYVGTFEEFGFFLENDKGELIYNSLSKDFKDIAMTNDEIWKIFKVGKDIYFQSFRAYYKYDGNSLTGYNDEKLNPLYLHEFEGQIYAQVITKGLYKVKDGVYTPFIDFDELKSSVISILQGRKPHEMMLITENNGIYYYNPTDGLTKFVTEADAEIMTNHVNRVIMTSDSVLMIGTTMDGLYAVNKEGKKLWHFNRDVRLNNNTVLGLYCDNARNVWVCMDDGISYIHYNSPITLYAPALSELKFGMVFDVYSSDNDLYLATNQGLYKYNNATNKLGLIPNTETQNWYVTAFDNQIFCGNNFHSMMVKDNVGVANLETTGSTNIKKCIINGEDLLIESSYTEFHIYRKNAKGQWVFSNNVKGLIMPVKNFEVDESGTIWASHMRSGLYKITLNSNFTKVVRCKRILELNNQPKSQKICVIKINGRIVFTQDDKFYTYDDLLRKIVPHIQLNKLLTGMSGVHSAVHVNENLFWLLGKIEYNLIWHQDGEYKIAMKLPFSVFDNPCLGEESNAFVYDGRYSYLNLNNSVACYDCLYKPLKTEQSNMKLGFVQAISSSGSMMLPLNQNIVDVSSDYRELIIELRYPHYDNIPIKYVYTLQGGGVMLKSENNNAFIRYSSLNSGEYSFEAVAFDATNQEVGRVTYQFRILPPFYLTLPAIFIYIVLLGAVIYFAVKWNTKRLIVIKEKQYEQEQMKQSIKLNEQERLIAEQNKQILESELTIKGKELASMVMGAIAKNSALEALKNSIQEQIQKDTYTKRFLNSLLNQIDENIENKEFWDVFQQNFDLIHANFFRHLRKSFPELTPNDLKFCALMRLNMSTKDIAQMTNLTVRGVEAARYRIRKKLEIPENESIVNFLIEFK